MSLIWSGHFELGLLKSGRQRGWDTISTSRAGPLILKSSGLGVPVWLRQNRLKIGTIGEQWDELGLFVFHDLLN